MWLTTQISKVQVMIDVRDVSNDSDINGVSNNTDIKDLR